MPSDGVSDILVVKYLAKEKKKKLCFFIRYPKWQFQIQAGLPWY